MIFRRCGNSTAPRRVYNDDPGYALPVSPPTLHAMLAPLTAVSWRNSRILFFLFSAAAVVAAGLALAALMPQQAAPTVLAVLAAVLAFGPVLTGLSTGQPVVFFSSLLLIAFTPSVKDRPWLQGALIGIAACAKPQLAVFFALYLIAARRWKAVSAAAIAGALIVTVAVVRLHGVAGWTAQWVAMMAKGFSPGHVNSALPSADYSHLLLNLQAFVLLFTSSESVATVIAFAVTGAGLILVLWWRRAGAAILLQLLAALTLLPAYHRYYDGTILLFAIPSTAIMWREGERRLAALNGALLFLLAFPFTAMLKVACAAYHVPPNAIVQLSLHLQPVVVAAIAATAVAALRRERVAG